MKRLLILSLLFTLSYFDAFSAPISTVILKNGTKLVGNIIVQRPGDVMMIEVTNATYIIEEAEVVSESAQKIRYENLSVEWKRWAIEKNALHGDADERFLTLYNITTKKNILHNVAKIDRNQTSKIVYLQLGLQTSKVKWADIEEIKKNTMSYHDSVVLNDHVITHSGKTFVGTIVSQKPGIGMTIKTSDSFVNLFATDIAETKKVPSSYEQIIYDKLDYVNSLLLKDGKVNEGIIIVQHYGKNPKEQYVILLQADGTNHRIQISDILEYRTNYKTSLVKTYLQGEVYINEFLMPKAKTKEIGSTIAYVDKTVFAYPEGIVTTCKISGTQQLGTWKLIALEKVTLENSKTTQGYTPVIKKKNLVEPSSIELIDGMTCISYTYLSPGYYSFVNERNMNSYIFKIKK